MKVCLVASAGGHLNQLLRLADSWKDHETFFIATSSVVSEKLKKFGKVYIVQECNRKNPLLLLKLFIQSLLIVLREKSKVVISTGAAAGCIECFLCKIIGAKVIWIDSITNVEKLSLSGTMVRYIADMFFVQWPELTQKYKKVMYVGTIV
jgi:UDP-N-acetylglucosamine:LPS N-acetylglucosamine transferase